MGRYEDMIVYVVMNGNCVDRIYCKEKSARQRASRLRNRNLHLPPTHYTVEEHILFIG